MEGFAGDEVSHCGCPPAPGLLEELSQTARQLLDPPGVTRVRLRAGCHVIELYCQPSTGGVGVSRGGQDALSIPAVDWSDPDLHLERPRPTAPAGRHRRPA